MEVASGAAIRDPIKTKLVIRSALVTVVIARLFDKSLRDLR